MNKNKLILVLTIFCISCSSAKSLRKARQSFLHIVNKHTISVCNEGVCEEQYIYSLGSGFIIGEYDDKQVGLTAGHVCAASQGSESAIEISTLNGEYSAVEGVLVYPNVDVCILTFPNKGYPAIPVAPKPPRIGDKAFSISAPLGTFNSNMVPMFEGRYLGKVPSPLGIELDAYSIPGTRGSSGGMIINEKGQVIGMTVMARVGLETFTLAVPHELLKVLIDRLNKSS